MEFQELHILLKDFLIIIGAAIGSAIVCHLARLPAIIGFITAGIAVGPHGLGFVASIPGAEFIVEIGIVLLLFSIGLECSADLFKHYRKSFFIIGFFQVVLTVAVTAGICYLVLNLSFSKSIFIGFLVSLSSTAIVLKLLQDSREYASAHGTCATGILLFQDLAVIPMTLAVPFLGQGGSSPAGSALTAHDWVVWVIKAVGLAIILILSRRFIIPNLISSVLLTRSRDLFILTILLLCFGVAYSVSELGMSLGMGAFIAGILISGSSYGLRVTNEILPLKDSFLALFFASIGMLIDFSFILKNVHYVIGLTFAVFILKVAIVGIVAILTKVPQKTALLAGLAVFQVGEFSLVLAELGIENGLLTNSELQYLLTLSAITMMATPLIHKFAPIFIMKSEGKAPVRKLPESLESSAKVFIIGYGEAGKLVAERLRAQNISYIIIEQNYSQVKAGQASGENMVLGDATNNDELLQLGIADAELVVVSVSGVSTTSVVVEKILTITSRNKLLVRVHNTRQANQLVSLLPAEAIIDAERISSEALSDKVNEKLT